MSENCDVIFNFPIYGQSGAIRKPDSGLMVCKTFFFWKTFFSLIVTFYRTKTENKNKKSLNTAVILLLWVYYFWQKILIFCIKYADICKIKKVMEVKSIFSKTTYMCLLTYQISSFQPILNKGGSGGSGGVILPPPYRKTKP